MRPTLISPIIALSLSVHCGTPQSGPDVSTDAATLDSTDAVVEVLDVFDVSLQETIADAAGPTDATSHDHPLPDVQRDASGHRDVARDEFVDTGPRTTQALNDCDPSSRSVVDLTAAVDPVIVSGPGYVFSPPCARLRTGQRVIFRIDSSTTWLTHSLSPGSIVMDLELPDPSSPIPLTESGNADVPVTFTEVGSYGFYCARHYLAGHIGAIHVVAP